MLLGSQPNACGTGSSIIVRRPGGAVMVLGMVLTELCFVAPPSPKRQHAKGARPAGDA